MMFSASLISHSRDSAGQVSASPALPLPGLGRSEVCIYVLNLHTMYWLTRSPGGVSSQIWKVLHFYCYCPSLVNKKDLIIQELQITSLTYSPD